MPVNRVTRTEKEISASSLITGNPRRNGILLARPLIIKQHRDADGVQLKREIQYVYTHKRNINL